jgi:hypothetical protein
MRGARLCSRLTVLLFSLVNTVISQTTEQKLVTDLAGTSWQLLKFQGSDDRTVTQKTTRSTRLRSTALVV